jgi:hypothetical protein
VPLPSLRRACPIAVLAALLAWPAAAHSARATVHAVADPPARATAGTLLNVTVVTVRFTRAARRALARTRSLRVRLVTTAAGAGDTSRLTLWR